jgi:hypothetical protein
MHPAIYIERPVIHTLPCIPECFVTPKIRKALTKFSVLSKHEGAAVGCMQELKTLSFALAVELSIFSLEYSIPIACQTEYPGQPASCRMLAKKRMLLSQVHSSGKLTAT